MQENNINTQNSNIQESPDPKTSILQKRLKRLKNYTIGAFVLFILLVLAHIIALSSYISCRCNDSFCLCGIEPAAVLFFGFPIAIISMVLAISALFLIRKLKKQNIVVPEKYKIFNIIVLLQIPFYFVSVVPAKKLRDIIIDTEREKIISEMQGQDEKILASCTSGDTEIAAAVIVPDFEYPIIKYANWETKDQSYQVKDNREELERGNEYNYQEDVKQIFGEEAISLLSISDVRTWTSYSSGGQESGTFRTIHLGIILPTSLVKSDSSIEVKSQKIANQYSELFPNQEFELNIYSTDKIEPDLVPYYYAYLGKIENYCSPGTEELEDKLKEEQNLYINHDF